MTVDEAMAIAETVLDYQQLNHVQEIVFRQAWSGLSYREIANQTGYDPDYLKDAGAKLWKQLSKALGEKVKKDNLKSVFKRYLRRHQITLRSNQVIGVNLTGGTLTEANLNGTKLFANLGEADSCKANVDQENTPESDSELEQNKRNSEDALKPDKKSLAKKDTYYWNGWRFSTAAQVKIAEALDRAGVLFFPNSKGRVTTTAGRENEESDFLVCYQGKLGILQVNLSEANPELDYEGVQSQGIRLVRHYEPIQCSEEPEKIVLEFLQLLG